MTLEIQFGYPSFNYYGTIINNSQLEDRRIKIVRSSTHFICLTIAVASCDLTAIIINHVRLANKRIGGGQIVRERSGFLHEERR